MHTDQNPNVDFDEPLIWIYDPHFPKATKSELKKDPLVDFDRPMVTVDKLELARLIEDGHKIELV
jgi:hypothetical protein